MIAWIIRLWSRLLVRLRIGKRDILWYVHTNEGLPPPLDPEEEARCIALAPTDREAKDKLIVHNLRLVVYLARKFDNTGVQTEDLISIGTIGLIKAVETFKPEKKIKLATYASRCIENEILMHLRRTTKLKLEVSFEEPLNVDWDGNELLISDILGSDSDVVNVRIEKESEESQLMQAVQKLSEREMTIMELRFGLNNKEPHTQKQVADMLGISQSYISRLEKKIISRLKQEIEQKI